MQTISARPGFRFARLAVAATIVLLLGACAAGSDGGGRGTDITPRAKILACKAGDTQVESNSQCLQDDAACYQKGDGAWCTGPRGNVCPAGSSKIPAGTDCPSGARCFAVGESLMCGISY